MRNGYRARVGRWSCALAVVLAATGHVVPANASGSEQVRGRWVNVTPPNVDPYDKADCDSFGSTSMQIDPARPSHLYTQFHCKGVWRSEDYGLTWTGPINVGRGGSGAKGAGSITVARGADGEPPILYSAAIRGSGSGFWRSGDG